MTRPALICVGSVLWDTIGSTSHSMGVGSDEPGRITARAGGVAFNIAQALAQQGVFATLLTHVGRDAAGASLLKVCQEMGLETSFIYQSDDLATDQYMAIEAKGEVIAAIADAHSLEKSDKIPLEPLIDGRLADEGAVYTGILVVDGNLTPDILTYIANLGSVQTADLRFVPASLGKVKRLKAVLTHPNATFYVNKAEAETLLDHTVDTAHEAADALCSLGAARAIVTDGPSLVADAQSGMETLTAVPPKVPARRLTGAGDTFMGAHIAAELRGLDRQSALTHAAEQAALYVSEAET